MTQPYTILIVDDDDPLRLSLSLILEKENYRVETAAHAEAALKCLQSHGYDLMFLDLNMPGMNGMEVAKEILNADPRQRIIFASAYVRDTLEHSVKELKQVVELLQKPFTLKQLTDTVEDTLAFDELKGLNVDVDRIKGADLTHAQIFDLLARLRRIQKNRTF